MDDLEKVRNIISYSNNIVFFGGAGMSTESGIPDFRSSNGIYSEEYDSYPPEYILSNTFFKTHPDIFYKFFREKSLGNFSGKNPWDTCLMQNPTRAMNGLLKWKRRAS